MLLSSMALLDVRDLAERDQAAAAASQLQALQALEIGTRGAREAHCDRYVFFLLGGVEQANGIARRSPGAASAPHPGR